MNEKKLILCVFLSICDLSALKPHSRYRMKAFYISQIKRYFLIHGNQTTCDSHV